MIPLKILRQTNQVILKMGERGENNDDDDDDDDDDDN